MPGSAQCCLVLFIHVVKCSPWQPLIVCQLELYDRCIIVHSSLHLPQAKDVHACQLELYVRCSDCTLLVTLALSKGCTHRSGTIMLGTLIVCTLHYTCLERFCCSSNCLIYCLLFITPALCRPLLMCDLNAVVMCSHHFHVLVTALLTCVSYFLITHVQPYT